MTDQEFTYWLKETITGQIDEKINYLAERAEGDLMEDYYYLSAVNFEGAYIGNTNRISDPVGNIAAELADIKLHRKRNYIFFKNLKTAAEKYLAVVDQENLKLLKKYMKLEEGYLRSWQKKIVREEIEHFKKDFVDKQLNDRPHS